MTTDWEVYAYVNGSYSEAWNDVFDPDSDTYTWIYIGISFAKVTSLKTLVCLVIKTTAPTGACREVEAVYTTSSTYDGDYYRVLYFGDGLKGSIRTIYIWNYAKAVSTMEMFATKKKNCDASSYAPEAYCLSCDPLVGSNACFDDCPMNHTGGFPCKNTKYDCPNMCLTCVNTVDCTHCDDSSFLFGTDCECNEGYYTANSTGTAYCVICHDYCSKCNGGLSTECTACADGYYMVVDTKQCVENCMDYGMYYYDTDSSRCQPCPDTSFTVDGLTCLYETQAYQYNITDNNTLIIEFSNPVIMNAQSADDAFVVEIKGDKDYDFAISTNATSTEYQTFVSVYLESYSTLYGSGEEYIIFKFRYQDAFQDVARRGISSENTTFEGNAYAF